jgi:hypothetical protein
VAGDASAHWRSGSGRSWAVEVGQVLPHQGLGLRDSHRHPAAKDQIAAVEPERQASQWREVVPMYELARIGELDPEVPRLIGRGPSVAYALDLAPGDSAIAWDQRETVPGYDHENRL